MKTILLYNAIIPGSTNGDTWVLFNREKILATGNSEERPRADEEHDAKGAVLMPGAVDAHVHFREPGLTHKADISSESRAALAGGVTAFFDMPNTVPQTVTVAEWQKKMELAAAKSAISYSFFLGATNDNLDELLKADYSRIPGIKVFIGSSTGNMLVDDRSQLENIFRNFKVPVVVHAEDEETIRLNKTEYTELYGPDPEVSYHTSIRSASACVRATEKVLEIARRFPDSHLHIAHLSTAREVELIEKAKSDGMHVTCEVSPHHLLFTTDDYARLGTRIKMNPSVKAKSDRDALRQAVRDGIVDIIATDHAPHLASEKKGGALTAVSGAPMIQFALPVVLDLFGAETAFRTMCANPAKIFGLQHYGGLVPGNYADISIIENCNDGYEVSDSDVLSKCGWTPLVGTILHHRVVKTYCHGPTPLTFSH